MRVKILHKYWDYRLGKPETDPDSFAEADMDAHIVRFNPDCGSARRLIVSLLHESLHAGLPCLDDDTVAQLAYDAGVVLDRLGVEIDTKEAIRRIRHGDRSRKS